MTHSVDFSPAPLFTDIHPGPQDGAAWWLQTADKKRIRVAAWNRSASTGTVLLFPGRTEYVEKYGVTAGEFAARGFATFAVDWRGQGLADRLVADPLVGYVDHFSDYQTDVAAALRAMYALDMPKPWFLVGHSMGGCIGLRSVLEDVPVRAAAFTGPMWGIRMSPRTRPAAWALGHIMPFLGRGSALPPGTKLEPYVLSDPFEDNMLTTDVEMFDMMRDQLNAHPDLALGGPSFVWLREALLECRRLAVMPSPGLPCLTFLGTNERIVDVPPIRTRMAHWDTGDLDLIEGGEHEVMMDLPAIRNRVFDKIATHFVTAS